MPQKDGGDVKEDRSLLVADRMAEKSFALCERTNVDYSAE